MRYSLLPVGSAVCCTKVGVLESTQVMALLACSDRKKVRRHRSNWS